MPGKFRVASFNVENLFRRVKVFTLSNYTKGDSILGLIEELKHELDKSDYNKAKILDLYGRVKDYIIIRVDRGKFWKGRGYNDIAATGKKDWDGSIDFKKAAFDKATRYNTARVIREVKADLLCLIEIEDKPALTNFNSYMLTSRYPYNMAIDAMDPRGIDVGLYSINGFGNIRTHIYDKDKGKTIFSRDCLEVEVSLPGGQPLFILCNHFKSKSGVDQEKSDAKRKMQAERVSQIIKDRYRLDKDMVIVAGDLNDTPDSEPLRPLMEMKGLRDVLEMQFPHNQERRWTYHYKKNEQIDYILISQPLQEVFIKAGVLRNGIYNLEKFTKGEEKSFDSITSPANQASDHGAVWVDFNL